MRAQLSLDAEAPLEEVWRRQRSAWEGVQVDGQGACWRVGGHSCTRIAVGLEGALKRLICQGGRIDGTVRHAWRDAYAADLTIDPAYEDGRVRRIHRSEIGHLRGNDVVEDASACMQRQLF